MKISLVTIEHPVWPCDVFAYNVGQPITVELETTTCDTVVWKVQCWAKATHIFSMKKGMHYRVSYPFTVHVNQLPQVLAQTTHHTVSIGMASRREEMCESAPRTTFTRDTIDRAPLTKQSKRSKDWLEPYSIINLQILEVNQVYPKQWRYTASIH